MSLCSAAFLTESFTIWIYACVESESTFDYTIPCFVNPNMSASRIATKSHRSLYDVFALPCSPSSYIPNRRIRTLVKCYQELSDHTDDVRNFEYYMKMDLKSLHTWRYSSGGSETHICNPNLSNYLSMINSRVGNNTTENTAVINDSLPFRLVLANQKSKSEQRIQWRDHVIIASEAKGVEHSHYAALVQGFEVGGDSSVNMWRCGLDTELAVTPVILSYGDCFCIYSVYLLPDCYPVIVQLSPPLTYLTLEGRCCLARWGIVLAKFALETIDILNKRLVGRDSSRKSKQPGLYIARGLFFKPLREFDTTRNCTLDLGSSLRTNLESLMLAYHRLHVVENSDRYILFPLGVIAYPSPQSESYDYRIRDIMDTSIHNHFPHHNDLVRNGCPVVVYEELSSEWSNKKPPSDVVQSYVYNVHKAVEVLNEAKISHMDLRPANILWRIDPAFDTKSEVEIRVIDLEDSVPFGFHIRCVDKLRNDPRYPVSVQDDRELIPATSDQNDWFGMAVASWAQRSDVNSFGDYMASSSELIFTT